MVPAASSKDLNHIKLIPQLFNESDTMTNKFETSRCKEFTFTDLEADTKKLTLAELILPKSKLNPSKTKKKKQPPKIVKIALTDLSDLKVFRQSQKCSDPRSSMKYEVYPKHANLPSSSCT